MAKSFTYKGIDYTSYSNFYLRNQDRATTSAVVFLRRVKKGMDLEEALTFINIQGNQRGVHLVVKW